MSSSKLRWLVDTDPMPSVDLVRRPDVLASWSFSHNERARHFTLDLSPLEPVSLVFKSSGRVRGGELNAAAFASDDELLLGELKLSELDQNGIKRTAAEAYKRMLELVPNSGYPYLLRVWSYFSGINEGEGDNERYKLFCTGRARGVGRAWDSSEPAATVIGRPHPSRWFHLLWIAAKTPGQAIDNPRQTRPSAYGREYGPEPPRFSRGTLWQSKRGAVLFISGTAAVVGDASLHVGDLAAQFAETERNLYTLLAEAAIRVNRPARFDDGTVLIAYVRDETAQFRVQRMLRTAFPNSPSIVVAGDICRRELLVEIEAVHHFDPPR
jgi:chorismate lyase/3-hydroxybenzoate synthase